MSAARPLVLCGPSGAGKSVLVKRLMSDFPGKFGFSVSHTTRAPRTGEEDGVHYNFSTHDVMEKMIENNEFIEYAKVHGNIYGTSIKAVDSVTASGQTCILDIDVQGVKSVTKTDLNARRVFIKPPSLEILEQRLRGRATDSAEVIEKRLQNAVEELKYAEVGELFDKVIVNDDLDRAYGELKDYVTAN